MSWENIFISTGVGLTMGILGFIGGRSKNKAEVRDLNANALGKEISNLRLIIESWREHSDRLEKQVDEQEIEIKEQKIIIQKQNERISELQSRIEELGEKISEQCNNCHLIKK